MNSMIVAIGNRLMGDDGIAIEVVKNIRGALELRGINVVIGETDVYYCLNEIFDADLVFILDSAYYGNEPGTITVNAIKNFKVYDGKELTQHGINLIKLIEMYNLDKEIYIIGIEVHEITCSFNISSNLNNRLNAICCKVQKAILAILNNTL